MILSGQPVAHRVRARLSEAVASFSTPPGLAVILVGKNASSHTYVTMKRRACAQVGIHSLLHHLSATTTESELRHLIYTLNSDAAVDGILVQLPLPQHLNAARILETIDPSKDVDGLHPLNLGKVLVGRQDGFVPCTPLGIKQILDHYHISAEGKHVVIVGRSTIVGKPLAALLLQQATGCNATVTVAHSRTRDLPHLTRQADILVAAVGIPRLIRAEMVKEGAVVIDVGINREDGHLVGDVDFQSVEEKCAAITPVPKGVGPMTVTMLLHNTVLSYQRRRSC